MKRLVVLCLIPLFAGCFAWDLDEKPYPWMDDPAPKKPTIGTVVYYGNKQPLPPPQPAVYVDPNRAPAPAAQPKPVVPPAPAPVVEPEAPAAPAAPAPVAEPVAPAKKETDTEKRLSSLESRLEDLYQLILKSYEKKK
ncbi:MAG: hypothetical protein ACYTHM_23130 [Planctomycetota bacterium]|jgi:hypothetical protein